MEFASDAVVEAIKAAEADTPAAADRASQILAHCAHNMHEYTVRIKRVALPALPARDAPHCQERVRSPLRILKKCNA